MIEAFWTSLKGALLADGGHDRLIEFLENATAFARIERAKSFERARMVRGAPPTGNGVDTLPPRPDYSALTPHDLQARVAGALVKP